MYLNENYECLKSAKNEMNVNLNVSHEKSVKYVKNVIHDFRLLMNGTYEMNVIYVQRIFLPVHR